MKRIAFVGGGSARDAAKVGSLMKHLQASYPQQFWLPNRSAVSMSINEGESEQLSSSTSRFGGYLLEDLKSEQGPLPLIALSINMLEEAAMRIPGLYVVFVGMKQPAARKVNDGDAEVQAAEMTGEELSRRRDVTEEEGTTTPTAAMRRDVTELTEGSKEELLVLNLKHLANSSCVFCHAPLEEEEGWPECVAPLMAQLCTASAKHYHSQMTICKKGTGAIGGGDEGGGCEGVGFVSYPLRDFFPLLAVANIRGLDEAIASGHLPPLWSWQLVMASTTATAPGIPVEGGEIGTPPRYYALRGQVGDLVVGDVIAAPNKKKKTTEGLSSEEEECTTTTTATAALLDEREDLEILDSTHHWSHSCTSEIRVLAALGNRESSTHVNGGIPEGGLMVPTPDLDVNFEDVEKEEDEQGAAAGVKKTVAVSWRTLYGSLYQQPMWITPNSGLAGCLLSEGSDCNPLAESSTGFRLLGLLRLPSNKNDKKRNVKTEKEEESLEEKAQVEEEKKVTSSSSPSDILSLKEGSALRQNLNVKSLAVRPKTTMAAFNTPIICIGATSAEAGKTTLTRKIIAALANPPHNLRLAGVKATGTGGIQDSYQHLAAGAFCAVDQVTSGLPTTYISAAEFSSNIWKSFAHCQDQGAAVIICEMGGDICWANNPTLLKCSWFQENLASMFVICNDSLAMLGAKTYLQGLLSEAGGSSSSDGGGFAELSSCGTKTTASCGGSGGGRGSGGSGIELLERRVNFVASPFRNHLGAMSRASSLGFEGRHRPMDPNKPELVVNIILSDLKSHHHNRQEK